MSLVFRKKKSCEPRGAVGVMVPARPPRCSLGRGPGPAPAVPLGSRFRVAVPARPLVPADTPWRLRAQQPQTVTLRFVHRTRRRGEGGPRAARGRALPSEARGLAQSVRNTLLAAEPRWAVRLLLLSFPLSLFSDNNDDVCTSTSEGREHFKALNM